MHVPIGRFALGWLLACAACGSGATPGAPRADAGAAAAPDGGRDGGAGVRHDLTPDAAPEQSPDARPDVAPDVAPDAAPDGGRDGGAGGRHDVTPDAAPELSPDARPELSPDARPDAAPDVTPDAAPDAAPDGPRDAGGDIPVDAGLPCGRWGSLGVCPEGSVCVSCMEVASWSCDYCHDSWCCERSCDHRACGSDGCGGSCGDCPEGQRCLDHGCVDRPDRRYPAPCSAPADPAEYRPPDCIVPEAEDLPESLDPLGCSRGAVCARNAQGRRAFRAVPRAGANVVATMHDWRRDGCAVTILRWSDVYVSRVWSGEVSDDYGLRFGTAYWFDDQGRIVASSSPAIAGAEMDGPIFDYRTCTWGPFGLTSYAQDSYAYGCEYSQDPDPVSRYSYDEHGNVIDLSECAREAICVVSGSWDTVCGDVCRRTDFDYACWQNCPECGCGQTCWRGRCVSTLCVGQECGDDGCGGSCGDCAADETCGDGVCRRAAPPVAGPDPCPACTPTQACPAGGPCEDCPALAGAAVKRNDYGACEAAPRSADGDRAARIFVPEGDGVPGFWIDRYEVTVADFLRFVRGRAVDARCGRGVCVPTPEYGRQVCIGSLPCFPLGVSWSVHWDDDAERWWAPPLCQAERKGPADAPCDDHPAVGVPLDTASEFCADRGMHVCSAAQWRRAACGGGALYPWGDDGSLPFPRRANCEERTCRDGFEATAPVGSFPAGRSAFGVDDLVGNATEWLDDGTIIGVGWFDGDRSLACASVPVLRPTGVREGDPDAWLAAGFRCCL